MPESVISSRLTQMPATRALRRTLMSDTGPRTTTTTSRDALVSPVPSMAPNTTMSVPV